MMTALIMILLGSAHAWSDQPIVVEINIGSRHSVFVLSADGEKSELEFRNSNGEKIKRKLAAAEIKAVDQKVRELPKDSHDLKLCPESHFRFLSRHGVREVCEGSQTPLGLKSRVIVQALLGAIK